MTKTLLPFCCGAFQVCFGQHVNWKANCVMLMVGSLGSRVNRSIGWFGDCVGGRVDYVVSTPWQRPGVGLNVVSLQELKRPVVPGPGPLLAVSLKPLASTLSTYPCFR